jgi:carbon-monoxide dehydrogenase catalytic subunit
VTGGPNLVKLLTEDLKDITGGMLNVETDPAKAVAGMIAHIDGRRRRLGL